MEEFKEDTVVLPAQGVQGRYIKSNLATLPLDIIVRRYYLDLLVKVRQGNLLRVHHLKTFRRLMNEIYIDDAVAFKYTGILANDILRDYKCERELFLRYHASFAIDNCINDIIKYLEDTAPVTSQ